MTDPTQLQAEAQRLTRLSLEELRTEGILSGLRLGEGSRQAAEELEQLDRELLSGLFGETAAQ